MTAKIQSDLQFTLQCLRRRLNRLTVATDLAPAEESNQIVRMRGGEREREIATSVSPNEIDAVSRCEIRNFNGTVCCVMIKLNVRRKRI